MIEHITNGEWVPEDAKPTFNAGANAYQRAIIQLDNGRIIPGFSFGETEEQCSANAWLMASAKELLNALQSILRDDPNKEKAISKAIIKCMGVLEKSSFK